MWCVDEQNRFITRASATTMTPEDEQSRGGLMVTEEHLRSNKLISYGAKVHEDLFAKMLSPDERDYLKHRLLVEAHNELIIFPD